MDKCSLQAEHALVGHAIFMLWFRFDLRDWLAVPMKTAVQFVFEVYFQRRYEFRMGFSYGNDVGHRSCLV